MKVQQIAFIGCAKKSDYTNQETGQVYRSTKFQYFVIDPTNQDNQSFGTEAIEAKFLDINDYNRYFSKGSGFYLLSGRFGVSKDKYGRTSQVFQPDSAELLIAVDVNFEKSLMDKIKVPA